MGGGVNFEGGGVGPIFYLQLLPCSWEWERGRHLMLTKRLAVTVFPDRELLPRSIIVLIIRMHDPGGEQGALLARGSQAAVEHRQAC